MQTTLTTGWRRQMAEDGSFARRPMAFRGVVSSDQAATHPAQAGRYHLYVSLACPWAHRTLMVRALKGLEQAISVDVVHPLLKDGGWSFDTGFPGATGDRVGGQQHLQDCYKVTAPDFSGIVTVPVLWDKLRGSIVNNESSEIIRMMNNAFQAECARPELDLYPAALQSSIDETNAWIYPAINNGVYRSGFAASQAVHEQAVDALFAGLDRVEGILETEPYLCGGVLTEADVRLFPTLIRFDAVYHTHFKCNRKLIAQYPGLHRYMARMYQLPGIANTVNMEHIRYHYYASHTHINPTGIVPRGPGILQQLSAAAL